MEDKRRGGEESSVDRKIYFGTESIPSSLPPTPREGDLFVHRLTGKWHIYEEKKWYPMARLFYESVSGFAPPPTFLAEKDSATAFVWLAGQSMPLPYLWFVCKHLLEQKEDKTRDTVMGESSMTEKGKIAEDNAGLFAPVADAWIPHRTEWRIYDEMNVIAGSVQRADREDAKTPSEIDWRDFFDHAVGKDGVRLLCVEKRPTSSIIPSLSQCVCCIRVAPALRCDRCEKRLCLACFTETCKNIGHTGSPLVDLAVPFVVDTDKQKDAMSFF